MSIRRRVTAAQKPSAAKGSKASWPPARIHFSDGAGCAVNPIAENPASSAARVNRTITSGSRNAGS